MALPLMPVLKLIALGSIKIIFLGLGALIVPVFTVRLVVGGTSESIRMATNWMIDHDKMDQEEADIFLKTLIKVQNAEYTRPQARGLLFAKIKKTASGTVSGVKFIWQRTLGLLSKGNNTNSNNSEGKN